MYNIKFPLTCVCGKKVKDEQEAFNHSNRCSKLVENPISRERFFNDSGLPDPLWFIPCVILFALFFLFIMTRPGEPAEIDLEKIAMIESSGCRNVIGHYEYARGCHQITRPVLDEYNQFNKSDYSMDDLLNASVSTTIADWYINKRIPQMIRYFGKPDTEENRIIAYNAGILYVKTGKPIPEITKRYLRKYFNE